MWTEDDAQLRPWLRAIAGVRADLFTWNVDDLNPRTVGTAQTTAGAAQQAIVSPKLTLVGTFGPVQLFAKAGTGFHSNDARAAVRAAGDGALAQAAGAELGARLGWRGLQLGAALWALHLSSEQVWNGDEGTTEPAGATIRYGLDTDAVWAANDWLSVDANVELAHASFVANAGNGNAVALAPKLLGGGGVTFHRKGTMVALRGRGIGPRPANDAGTLTADGYFIVDLVAAQQLGRWRLGLTIENLLDSAWREAQFAETSRLPGEPAAVEDVHFTPGTPFVAFLTVGLTL
jgi:outer membrane receptor protein involved in Fe transport